MKEVKGNAEKRKPNPAALPPEERALRNRAARDLWEEWYRVRSAEQQARLEAGAGAEVDCTHDVAEVTETAVFAVVCVDCHALLGSTTRDGVPAGYAVFTGDGGRVAYRRSVS